MKKKIFVLLMLSLCFILSFAIIRNYVNAIDRDTVEKNYQNYQFSKFIDDISFKNNEISKEYRLSDMVKLQYTWSLTDQKKGDELVYTIPKEMYIVNDLNFSLLTNKGEKIGEIDLFSETNQLKIKFTDPDNLMETKNKMKGIFYFTVKLSPESWNKVNEKTIEFPMGENEKKLTIKIKKEDTPLKSELINGWGMYNKQEKLVDWNLRINYAEKVMPDASIKIMIGNKNEIDTDSFQLFEIKNNDLVNTSKEIKQSVVDGKLILSIKDVTKPYLIAFKASNSTNQATLSATLSNYSNQLAETGELTAFYTTGASILNDAS